MHSDVKKRLSSFLVALFFAAGDLRHYALTVTTGLIFYFVFFNLSILHLALNIESRTTLLRRVMARQ